MIHSEIDQLEKIDIEVQTSLDYLQSDTRGYFEEELRKLREDKSLLEGKIRGYLTLSEICREYKEELTKLRQEYDKLLQTVNANSQLNMSFQQSRRTGSPTSGKDLGPFQGHDSEQHTRHPHHESSFSAISRSHTSSVASEILQAKESPIRTKELFDHVEDPRKSSEGNKSMPHSFESKFSDTDKYPMQESMAEESGSSVTGLGFERLSDNMSLGKSAGQMRSAHGDDLINFSYPTGRPPPGGTRKQPAVISGPQDTENIENIVKSLHLESQPDLNKVVEAVKKYSSGQTKNLAQSNQVLVVKNNELQKENLSLKEDNKRLVEKIKKLEQQVYDLSMSREGSPQAQGWVQVEKYTTDENVLKTTEIQQQKSAISSDELEILKQRNLQLTEANQRWSNEWQKLQEHFETRIADLQTERDRLAKEMTELKITEESKQRDFEKMLMNSKKKASDEENAKEEAFFQLNTANNQVEDLRLQLQQSQDMVAALRREKQVLETELSVIRQSPLGAGTLPNEQGSRPSRSVVELKTENDVLRQQLLVFQEDFDRERQDRAKAMAYKDDYKKQNEQYKKRVRHVEQKNVNLERQFKASEESVKKLQEEKSAMQQEISSLKLQLQREMEKTRNLIPSQLPYQPPLIQSAGMQPQRQMIFGQQVQQRPQQYVIQPAYDQHYQRLAPMAGGIPVMNYMPSPGSQYLPQVHQQGVTNPPAAYYQANQAGKQSEHRTGSWSCMQCTYVNYPGRTVCEMCGYIQSPSTNHEFNYRQIGNDTLHARGDPRQQQQQQQGPFGGFGGTTSSPREVVTDNINY